jgi:hypothetical protein
MKPRCFREVYLRRSGHWGRCVRTAKYMVQLMNGPQPVCWQHSLGYPQNALGPLPTVQHNE